MRKTLSVFLITGTMSAALAMAPAAIPQALAAPASHAAVTMHVKGIRGCRDSDYTCGYRQGYMQGAKDARALCGKHRHMGAQHGGLTRSEQGYLAGYTAAFNHFCPV